MKIPENVMPQTIERADGRVASASSCPTLDCGSLVIEYRAADIGEESERKGTSSLTARQIEQVIKASRAEQSKR